jgi:uncharacterized protein (TIGR02996 family)
MADLDDLYRVILARPDDDTPRLAYADALEDADDPRRAAFVRAQVAASRVPEYDPARVRYEYAELAALFDPIWVLGLPDLPAGLNWAREPFRRGMPSAIQAQNGAAFAEHAAELFTHYPIDTLELSAGQMAHLGELAQCPELASIVRLEFATGVSGPAARRVFNSRHATKLTELSVGADMTVAASARELVRSKVFRRLAGLSWRDEGRGGGAVVAELTQLADPPHLDRLDLSGNRINGDRAGRLAAAPALAWVEELDLSDNPLGPIGMAFLSAAQLPHLRVLRLLRTTPRVEGVRALLTAAFAPGLRSLALGGNGLGPAAAAVLAAAPTLAELRLLDLGDNRVGDRGAEALADSPHLANLVRLDLAENGIEARGAAALAASKYLGNLIHLNLSLNQITPAAERLLRDRFGDRVRI